MITAAELIKTLPEGVKRGRKMRHPFHSQSSVLVTTGKLWIDFQCTGQDAITHLKDLLGEPRFFEKPVGHPIYRLYY